MLGKIVSSKLVAMLQPRPTVKTNAPNNVDTKPANTLSAALLTIQGVCTVQSQQNSF